FPIAPAAQKSGTFVNWEGRHRSFDTALRDTGALPDLRVLDSLADEMGVALGLPTADAARDEWQRLGTWDGGRVAAPDVTPGRPPQPGPGEAVLASWRMLLDAGRLQDGEPNLAGTARKPVVRLAADTADEIGAAAGDLVNVATSRGSISLPLAIADLPPRVVWLPMNSAGSAVHQQLGVTAGAVVQIGQGS
ncbi:MAG: molybdopterin dinucleotide binding domain-containing protein, partial [Mycobacterium sp.]